VGLWTYVSWIHPTGRSPPVELKLSDLSTRHWAKEVRKDIEKHLDPARPIRNVCDSCERYNAVFAITKDDRSEEDTKTEFLHVISTLLMDPVISISDAIKLNGLDHREGHLWNYARIVVFTGKYVSQSSTVSSATNTA